MLTLTPIETIYEVKLSEYFFYLISIWMLLYVYPIFDFEIRQILFTR
jgi:hypothetical protein